MKTTNPTINDKEGKAEDAKENVPMKIRKETLNYDKKRKPTSPKMEKKGE
jgi:hypothetical protein